MSPRFRSLYWKLCFLSVAQLTLASGPRAIQPSDCQPGHMDSSCAKPVGDLGLPTDPPPSPPPPPPPMSFALSGQPSSGYWYWGYDFQTPDAKQGLNPRFVNRSGQSLNINISFTVPSGPCGGGCLPGVEFYFDQGVHKRDPKLIVSGTTASTSVPVDIGDRYAFIIGLWQAKNPIIAVTTRTGSPVPPEQVGLTARPDISNLSVGETTSCQCADASVQDCYLGDHYSNGLSGSWSQTMGLHRLSSWTNCSYQGGG